MTVDPDTGTVYVANSGDDTVSVINGTDYKPIGDPIPVGASPSGIVESLDGKIYVTNERTNTISVLSKDCIRKENCKSQNHATVKSPTAIAVDPNTGNFYVTSGKTNNVFITYAPIQPHKIDIAFDSNTNSLYSLNSNKANGTLINKMDTTKIKLTRNIKLHSDISFNNATSIVIDAASKKIYLTSYEQNSISSFDTKTNKSLTRTPDELVRPFDIAVHPVTGDVFITTGVNTVITINGSTLERLGDPIPVGASPTAITVNPENRYSICGK